MQLSQQWAILIYPFRHGLFGENRPRFLSHIQDAWVHWWQRLSDDQLLRTLDDTYFFLPYIREILFPETEHLPTGEFSTQLPAARSMSKRSLPELGALLASNAVLHLTLPPARRDHFNGVTLGFERRDEQTGKVVEQFQAPFEVNWVDVYLFPQQIGLLALKVQMTEEYPHASRLNDFLYYIRRIHPPKVGFQLARWKWQNDGKHFEGEARDIIDYLLQGLVETGAKPPILSLEQFLVQLSNQEDKPRYTYTREGQIYGEIFHLYIYASLTQPPEYPHEEQLPNPSPFSSAEERLIYELATCTDTSDPNYVPAPDYWQTLKQQGLFTFWNNWKGLALNDNVLFLANRDNPFTRNVLSYNVENDYLFLYLLSLFQKTRLSIMFGELIRRDSNTHKNLKEARHLWETFIQFQNQYWFQELTRKPLGREIYRYFQQGLQLQPLYRELERQAEQLQDFYERRTERRISNLLNFITFIGFPAGLLVGLYGGALIRETSWTQFGIVSAVVYVLVGLLWWIWRRSR